LQIARKRMPGFISNQILARELMRIGDEAIARENDAMLQEYFAADYVLHLPTGELDFDALRSYFASLRAAFKDLRIVREQIIVEGLHVAARTSFSGVFEGVFTQSPVGPLAPHGQPVSWEIMNMFRYNADARLAEEWVQTDPTILVEKLRTP
jgi:predicted ester cyclase